MEQFGEFFNLSDTLPNNCLADEVRTDLLDAKTTEGKEETQPPFCAEPVKENPAKNKAPNITLYKFPEIFFWGEYLIDMERKFCYHLK